MIKGTFTKSVSAVLLTGAMVAGLSDAAEAGTRQINLPAHATAAQSMSLCGPVADISLGGGQTGELAIRVYGPDGHQVQESAPGRWSVANASGRCVRYEVEAANPGSSEYELEIASGR